MAPKEKRSHQAVGRMSRRKGAAYELQIAKRLQEIYPNAKRGLGQARSGHEAADVENTPGWWVQTKHGKRPNLFEALEQSDLDRNRWASLNGAHESWRKPLVIARKNGEKDIATLYLDDFLEILGAALKKNVEMIVNQVEKTVPNPNTNGDLAKEIMASVEGFKQRMQQAKEGKKS